MHANYFSNSLSNSLMDRNIKWNNFSSSILLEITRHNEVYTCSAVAITRNVLLTAAHCVQGLTSARAMLEASYDPHSEQAIAFKDYHIHPGYNAKKSNFNDDIAIVILEHNLPEHKNLAVIDWHLDTKSILAIERIGFGGRDDCNTRTWTNPSELTFYSSKAITLKDENAVIGDSGGPVFAKTLKGLRLIGIHSTLEGKNKTYSCYVASYKKWIESHLPLRPLPCINKSCQHGSPL